MSSIVRLLAAAALLGTLAGCANFGMPNWTPNAPADSLQDPAIYDVTPANG